MSQADGLVDKSIVVSVFLQLLFWAPGVNDDLRRKLTKDFVRGPDSLSLVRSCIHFS